MLIHIYGDILDMDQDQNQTEMSVFGKSCQWNSFLSHDCTKHIVIQYVLNDHKSSVLLIHLLHFPQWCNTPRDCKGIENSVLCIVGLQNKSQTVNTMFYRNRKLLWLYILYFVICVATLCNIARLCNQDPYLTSLPIWYLWYVLICKRFYWASLWLSNLSIWLRNRLLLNY